VVLIPNLITISIPLLYANSDHDADPRSRYQSLFISHGSDPSLEPDPNPDPEPRYDLNPGHDPDAALKSDPYRDRYLDAGPDPDI
jgi:hypothetical protein